MNESADYLWDRSADEPQTERELQQLEQLLQRFAHDGRDLQQGPASRRPARRAWPWLLAVAASVFVLLRWLPEDRLQVGSAPRTFVAAERAVTVPLAPAASVVVAPGGELQFVAWREHELLLRLLRGEVAVRMEPATALLLEVDGGRITIDADVTTDFRARRSGNGAVELAVAEGAVAFHAGGRARFVPAGAHLLLTQSGRGTPLFDDARARLRDICRKFDGMSPESPFLVDGAEQIARTCEAPRDALVLWHLLAEPQPVVRKVAEDALRQLVGMPPGFPVGAPPIAPDVWLAFLRTDVWQSGR